MTIRFAVQDDRLVIYGVDPDEVIVSDMAPSHENGNWLTGIDNYGTFKTIRHEEPPAVVLRRRVWWGPDGSVSYKAVYVFNKEKQEYDKFEIPSNSEIFYFIGNHSERRTSKMSNITVFSELCRVPLDELTPEHVSKLNEAAFNMLLDVPETLENVGKETTIFSVYAAIAMDASGQHALATQIALGRDLLTKSDIRDSVFAICLCAFLIGYFHGKGD